MAAASGTSRVTRRNPACTGDVLLQGCCRMLRCCTELLTLHMHSCQDRCSSMRQRMTTAGRSSRSQQHRMPLLPLQGRHGLPLRILPGPMITTMSKASRHTCCPRYVAGPYQKDAAQRSAQRAIVPWAPYGAGVGERVGSLMAAHGPASGGLFGPPWNQQPPQAVWQGWPAENAGQGWKLLPAGQAPIGQQGGAPGQQAEGVLGAEGMQPYEGLYHPSPAQAEAYDRVAGRVSLL